uniref:Uncharacterized protein n=1 Tax=Bactrocera latifrons TaxID=174628 RepID=A0A0K8UG75_BACLA
MAKLGNIDTTGIGGVSSSTAGGLLTTSHDDGVFAMLACVGVFICMISTLVAIKIWWFKHRLTFDHSRTSNGAAGGATPTLPLRTRSSREKRMSQEPSEIFYENDAPPTSSQTTTLRISSVFYSASLEISENHKLNFQLLDNGQLRICIDKQ